MKLPINRRLLACCELIPPGQVVADVGCDHGYLGIHLLQTGVAKRIIAADLRSGPLDSARQNAAKYGLSDQMECYLSDGVQSIPRDFQTLTCAGMGMDTIISILSAAPWLKDSAYRLILQCQSKTALLRKYLSEEDWFIQQELVRRDGRFLYTVMEVLWMPQAPRLTPGGCYFPPALLAHPDSDTVQYCRWIYRELKKIVTSRGDGADVFLREALLELEQDPQYGFLKEDVQ